MRPKSTDPRDHKISIYLTASEAALLRQLAQQEHRSLNSTIVAHVVAPLAQSAQQSAPARAK